MTNRSRNLFFAASAGPLEPSVEFLRIVQPTLSASQIVTKKLGTWPSKTIYHRAKVSLGAVGRDLSLACLLLRH